MATTAGDVAERPRYSIAGYRDDNDLTFEVGKRYSVANIEDRLRRFGRLEVEPLL
jgi:hypothetical protein